MPRSSGLPPHGASAAAAACGGALGFVGMSYIMCFIVLQQNILLEPPTGTNHFTNGGNR